MVHKPSDDSHEYLAVMMYVGSIAGYIDGEKIAIILCEGIIVGRNYVGGVAGYSRHSFLEQCSSSCHVSGSDLHRRYYWILHARLFHTPHPAWPMYRERTLSAASRVFYFIQNLSGCTSNSTVWAANMSVD
jgi:hypothetical protein